MQQGDDRMELSPQDPQSSGNGEAEVRYGPGDVIRLEVCPCCRQLTLPEAMSNLRLVVYDIETGTLYSIRPRPSV